jgi:hypothetical protein
MIAILPIMGLIYGSGALLIREVARRTRRGWGCIALLACAYGFIEEGLVTQSLFNPNYLGLRLLDFGFIPALGTALPWLVFVISIHVIWSICVPIGLTESLFRRHRDRPWLGTIGTAICCVLFLAGCALIAVFTYKQRPFVASPGQFAATVMIVIGLIVAAMKWARPHEGRFHPPHPAILFAAALIPGSALMGLQQLAESRLHFSAWGCVAAVVGVEATFVLFMALFARGKIWTDRHRFALVAGGFLTYAWIGFVMDVELHGAADLPAHSILALLLCLVLVLAGYRSSRDLVAASCAA